jgi:hypothetical protein
MRNEENPKRGGAMRQRVKVQGTYTARVPGAITRKIAEPSRAMARFMSSRIANINALRRRCPRPWPRSPRHNLPDSDAGHPGADGTAVHGA